MKKKYFNRILLVMCACVIAYAFLLPLLFMLFTSFKGLAEAMTSSTLLPHTWTLQNYRDLFASTSTAPIFKWLMNTAVVTVTILSRCQRYDFKNHHQRTRGLCAGASSGSREAVHRSGAGMGDGDSGDRDIFPIVLYLQTDQYAQFAAAADLTLRLRRHVHLSDL